ncbi:MAG: response regulator [Lachnospiraceae bacterium]|nr:response regulator [Lachnospiraceae bacterium]
MLQVLLVDDDVNMLDLLRMLVPWEKYGYEIMGSVQNGKDALSLIMKTMPDLIITDVKMPVMDGLSFCSNVRQLRDDIPIILLSAYEDMETARLALKFNVTEYMLKPLTPQNIDLLCQILQELAHNYEQQTFFSSICSIPNRQKEITARLKASDSEWFQKFFATFTNCTSIPFQAIQATCFVMVRLLYTGFPNASILIAEQNDAISQCTTKLEMVSLIAELYNQVINTYSKKPLSADYQKNIFQQIYNYTNKNYMLPDCGVAMISERFHFSPDHINRLFHRYTGETLNAYINKKKMEYALELLKNPKLSINEVASLSGFQNQNYFSRVFRKKMQITPTEYRLQILLNSTDE